MEIYSCSPSKPSCHHQQLVSFVVGGSPQLPAELVRFLEANTELLVEVKREPVEKAEALGGERMLRMNTNLSFDFKKVFYVFF